MENLICCVTLHKHLNENFKNTYDIWILLQNREFLQHKFFSISYPYLIHLSLLLKCFFFTSHNLALKNLATKLVVLNF